MKLSKKQIKILLPIFGVGVAGFLVFAFLIPQYTQLLQASLFIDLNSLTAREKSKVNTLEQDKLDTNKTTLDCQVTVVGGGSGGTAAAIQSARMGIETCLIEETDWLGGMLSNAGVSAIDGHPETASGIFREIKKDIIHYYYINNRLEETRNCKVSPFCFEPRIGNEIIVNKVKETENLQYFPNSKVTQIYKTGNKIEGVQFKNKEGQIFVSPSKVTIDATEFGDLMYMAEIPFSLGKDVGSKESLAKIAEDCIQPLTYVAILKNDPNNTELLKEPRNYDPKNYSCVVEKENRAESSSHFDINHLQNYGKMPNNKLMINIPSHSCGNDFNATQAYLDSYSREEVLEEAKEYTRGFVYYMQNELGLTQYRIHNEFGTKDGLAKTPYVRESRRLIGVTRLLEEDVLPDPKTGRSKLQKTSIAIGDYPIDLHFCQTGVGDVFQPVKPYQIPYGVLVPKNHDGFLSAEKNISVSRIVNGTTRLQPVVMSIGQAAGAAAAIAASDNLEPREINIKKLQKALTDAGSNIFYFSDVNPDHFAYKEVTELAMNAILKGNPDFTYKPSDTIKKDQFLTIISRALEIDSSENLLDQLAEKGIVFPESFLERLNTDLTYQELVQVIAEGMLPQLTTTVDAQPIPFREIDFSKSYAENLEKLINNQILTKRHPAKKSVSRAEAAIIIYRILNTLTV
jgi:hypothetical protein